MSEYTITPLGYPSITVKVRGLCDECEALGYCRLSNNKLSSKRFTVKDYLNLVPAHFYCGKMGKYSKFHLQVACDAFHQEDYETAILNFRAVLEADDYYNAIIGLAVACFMVKDYDNAAIFAERCSTSYTPAIIESLKDDIAKLASENATLKEEEISETAPKEIDIQSANEFILQHASS
jgi:hypothetical protein